MQEDKWEQQYFTFLIKLWTNYYVFCCIIILISFSHIFHHMLFFFLLDFFLFYKCRWFWLCSISICKSENHCSVLTVFLGTICSCLSKASEWLILISALPLCSAVSRRDSSPRAPSSHSLQFKNATVASCRYNLDEFIGWNKGNVTLWWPI